jgi:hypothetical protein
MSYEAPHLSTAHPDEQLPSPTEVRRWARERGIAVGRRGPVNPSVMKRYIEAHSV